jgi:hypothetical protein
MVQSNIPSEGVKLRVSSLVYIVSHRLDPRLHVDPYRVVSRFSMGACEVIRA